MNKIENINYPDIEKSNIVSDLKKSKSIPTFQFFVENNDEITSFNSENNKINDRIQSIESSPVHVDSPYVSGRNLLNRYPPIITKYSPFQRYDINSY